MFFYQSWSLLLPLFLWGRLFALHRCTVCRLMLTFSWLILVLHPPPHIHMRPAASHRQPAAVFTFYLSPVQFSPVPFSSVRLSPFWRRREMVIFFFCILFFWSLFFICWFLPSLLSLKIWWNYTLSRSVGLFQSITDLLLMYMLSHRWQKEN